MNALANKQVGKYINENFCSAFQKVATFRIVGRQKQGGNVAAYFCAPDSRVLHVVAGPVNAATMLREAKWVVDNVRKAMKLAKNDGGKFKAYFRKAHADKVRRENGLKIEPVTFDPPEKGGNGGALTYSDPTGRPLAPKLPPPPVDGPDVKFRALAKRSAAPGAALVLDRRGRRWGLTTQGRADRLMAAHCMRKIEKVYGAVFEGILGEKITTKPVVVVNPFPWVNKKGVRIRR